MKYLIYQYWDGDEKEGNLTGIEFMKNDCVKLRITGLATLCMIKYYSLKGINYF